ncbi:hemolysin-type calcium-binding repeat family protein [Synechococcus sp. A15-127]|uniref:cadherin-like domain-containing protein n=1 Tax=Synechococcus sp. A15-127 TaxID=1050624 RepID=UPI0016477DF2|nr:cadherin-like domain-containing protein [Synechococcus sp. A15-127]QNI95250.1 hemolysin-type calcium-binding repeat family protein [Synechococcus sp. A15-127]
MATANTNSSATILAFGNGLMESAPTQSTADNNIQTENFTNASWDSSKGVKIEITQSGTATVGFSSYIPESYTGPGALFLYEVDIVDQDGNTILSESFDNWSPEGDFSFENELDEGQRSYGADLSWEVWSSNDPSAPVMGPNSIFNGFGKPFDKKEVEGDTGIIYPMDGDGPFSTLIGAQIDIPEGTTEIYINPTLGYNVSNFVNDERLFAVGFGYGDISAKDLFSFSSANNAPILSVSQASLPSVEEDSTVKLSSEMLLEGFSDVDGDALSITNLSATNGTLTNNEDGTWSFVPDANFLGQVALSYEVVDGKGGSVAATNSFEITASDEAPSPAPTPEPVVEVTPEPVVEAEPSMATFELYDFAAPQKIFTRVEQLADGDLAPFTLNAQINDMNDYNLVSRKERATKQDDWIRSGRQDDVISARGGSDIVQGRRGDDALNGGAGNDIIFGGRGDDILNGGRGINLLVGGAGQDSFDLRKGRNTVADFEAGDVWSCGTTIENVELSQTARGILMTCGTTSTHFVDAIKEDILAGFTPIDALT